MDHPKPQRKTLPYWLTVLLGVVTSCILMNLVTNLFQAEIFESWTTLDGAPAGIRTIVDATPNQVWVETQNGNRFTADVRFSCPGDFSMCWEWKSVSNLLEIPQQTFPVRRGDTCKDLQNDISPRNPRGEMVECVYSYELGAEYREEGYFALMSDGSVLHLHGGGASMTTDILFIFSTLVFPVIVAIIISVVYLVIYVIRRDFRKT